MDILSLQLFLRVAQTGVLSAAARDLSLSPASASARLSKLEQTIGFRLFNRTTRAISLSTDGAEFLPYARQTIETLEAGLSVVSGQGAQAKGLLRMAMSGSFARMYIIPTLSEFRTRYPQVDLDLRLSDEIHDVIEGGYDLIIRNAELADSSLMARKLATDRRIVLAAPSYLEKHGTPTTPEALSNHQCVNFNDNNKWHFQNGQSISTDRSLSVNDGEAMRTLIENGFGIGIKSLWNASHSLKSGKLIEVLPDYPLVAKPSIWALYPGNRVIAPKVRVMIDFLVECFSPVPPWER